MSALLIQQHAAGFSDIAGARADATIPVSDRLLNQLIADALPPGGAVREVQVQTHAGNRLTARVRVGRSPLLPAVTVRLSIEQQPELPASRYSSSEWPLAGSCLSRAPPSDSWTRSRAAFGWKATVSSWISVI